MYWAISTISTMSLMRCKQLMSRNHCRLSNRKRAPLHMTCDLKNTMKGDKSYESDLKCIAWHMTWQYICYTWHATRHDWQHDKIRHSRNPDLFLAVGFLSLYYGSRSNPDALHDMPNNIISDTRHVTSHDDIVHWPVPVDPESPCCASQSNSVRGPRDPSSRTFCAAVWSGCHAPEIVKE